MKKPITIAIQDAYDLFALDNKARRLTQSTQAFYRHKVLNFASWLAEQGVTLLADVTSAHIKTFLLSLAERNLAGNSQHDYARAIKTFLRYCVRDELLEKSPFERVTMPRVEETIPVTLTDEEIRTCMKRISDTRNLAIFQFILDSGVRASELIALTVGDVDMETGVVTVRQGKGQKDRLTSVGIRTRLAIKRLIIEREHVTPKSPLFPSGHTGKHLALVGLMHIFRKLQKETGIPHLTAHTVRRTMATRLLRGGMDAYVLSRMLGHSDMQVLRRYAAVDAELVRKATEDHSVVDNL